MDKLNIPKKQQKDLLKLKKIFTDAYAIWLNLPEDLKQTLYDESEGDSLGACINRGEEAITEICESI